MIVFIVCTALEMVDHQYITSLNSDDRRKKEPHEPNVTFPFRGLPDSKQPTDLSGDLELVLAG